MGFSPLVNTLQFLQGVNARETCASFWTGRARKIGADGLRTGAECGIMSTLPFHRL